MAAAGTVQIAFESNLGGLKQGVNKAVGELRRLEGVSGKIGQVLAGALAIRGVTRFGKDILYTRAELEKLEVVLGNTLGSTDLAAKTFSQLEAEARNLPATVSELAGAFVKLNNQAITGSVSDMRKLSDVASFTGKSIDQLSEALIDGVTFEFERFKEFGIKFRQESNKLVAQFRGQTTEIEKSRDAVVDYVLALSEQEGVQGSSAAIMTTLTGKISILNAAYENLLNTIGKAGQAKGFGGILGLLTDELDSISSFVKQVEYRFIDIDDLVAKNGRDFKQVSDAVEGLKLKLKALNNEASFFTDSGFAPPPRVARQIKETEAALRSQRELLNDIGGIEGRDQPLAEIYGVSDKDAEKSVRGIKTIKEEIKALKEEQEGVGLSESIRLQVRIEGLEKELKKFTKAPVKLTGVLGKGETIESIGLNLKEIEKDISAEFRLGLPVVPKRDTEGIKQAVAEISADTANLLADVSGITFDPFGGITYDKARGEIALLQNSLQKMLDEGVLPTDEKFLELADTLNKKVFKTQIVDAFGGAITGFADEIVGGFERSQQATERYRDALEEAGGYPTEKVKELKDAIESTSQIILNGARSVIKAFISEGVAALIANTLKGATGLLGPLALPIAAAAGTGAAALFSALVPKFATGGVVTGPTYGLIGEAGPEVIFPLQDLKRFIGDVQGGGGTQRMEAEIQGDKIRLVSKRAQRRAALLY